ncbi:MAG: glycoside hydrolase family 15 protein [Thermodesulfobacteriota bacterium]
MLCVHNETLLDLLRQRYLPADLDALRRHLLHHSTFALPEPVNGLYPAIGTGSRDAAASGYRRVWVRDNCYIALSQLRAGTPAIALAIVAALRCYFRKHRHRFEAIIDGAVDFHLPMNRPHIRFDGATLAEVERKWPHAQNDALGYFLWLYCRMAGEGLLAEDGIDLELLALFVRYFARIEFWRDEDSGHWEEGRKVSASSVGTVTAALRELRAVLLRTGREEEAAANGIDPQLLHRLIGAGQAALAEILPAESVQAGRRRPVDGALLFLVYPLQAVDDAMADRIIANVAASLSGAHGIRRYRGDSYWCADYKTHLREGERSVDCSDNLAARDALLREGEEAQWCIFDPILSVIHGERWLRCGDDNQRRLQVHHFNRAIAQLTAADCPSGPLRCPEAYYLERGVYVPNDQTPLLWTQSNLLLAFQCMARTVAAPR